ncbi:hypothetical protein BT69DRAFT_1077989 [Atractiella rhizophila]|nr:hypothetical protein BT69DRAFT_1077989 [Atractiella rhizophila]
MGRSDQVYQQDLSVIQQSDESALGLTLSLDFGTQNITELFLKVEFNIDNVNNPPRIRSMFPCNIKKNWLKGRQNGNRKYDTIAYPKDFENSSTNLEDWINDGGSSLGLDTRTPTWMLTGTKTLSNPSCFSLVVKPPHGVHDIIELFPIKIEVRATKDRTYFFVGRHNIPPWETHLQLDPKGKSTWYVWGENWCKLLHSKIGQRGPRQSPLSYCKNDCIDETLCTRLSGEPLSLG